jgi:hypothetical protein
LFSQIKYVCTEKRSGSTQRAVDPLRFFCVDPLQNAAVSGHLPVCPAIFAATYAGS